MTNNEPQKTEQKFDAKGSTFHGSVALVGRDLIQVSKAYKNYIFYNIKEKKWRIVFANLCIAAPLILLMLSGVATTGHYIREGFGDGVHAKEFCEKMKAEIGNTIQTTNQSLEQRIIDSGGVPGVSVIDIDEAPSNQVRFTLSNGRKFKIPLPQGKTGTGIEVIRNISENRLQIEYDDTKKLADVVTIPKPNDGVSVEKADYEEESGELSLLLSNKKKVPVGKIKGKNGLPGAKISSAQVTKDGTLAFSLSDGTTIPPTANSLKGPKGDRGDKGNDGVKGDRGDKGNGGVGVSEIFYDSNPPQLVFEMSDNSTPKKVKLPTTNNAQSGVNRIQP